MENYLSPAECNEKLLAEHFPPVIIDKIQFKETKWTDRIEKWYWIHIVSVGEKWLGRWKDIPDTWHAVTPELEQAIKDKYPDMPDGFNNLMYVYTRYGKEKAVIHEVVWLTGGARGLNTTVGPNGTTLFRCGGGMFAMR